MKTLRHYWLAALVAAGLMFTTGYSQDKKEATKPVQAKVQEVKVDHQAEFVYALSSLGQTNANATATWAVLNDQALAQWTGAYGLNVSPVDDTLRNQLQLPAGDAMVIVGFAQADQGEKLALRQHDVLLDVGKNPDPTKPVLLTVYRQGKPQKVQLPAATPAKKLWIGVDMEVIEEKAPLRSQLKLEPNAGLLLTNIYDNSPAQKAGLKLHDVVYEVSGRVLTSTDDLATAVQQSEQKPLALLLYRQASPLSIQVTPQVRPQPAESKDRVNAAVELSKYYLSLDAAALANAQAGLVYQVKPRMQNSTIKLSYEFLATRPSAVQQLESLQQDLATLQQQSASIQEKIAAVLKQVKEEKK